MTSYGMPIWYELMTTDVDGARRFYGDVVGWTATSFPVEAGAGGEYVIWNADDGTGVGGLIALPDGAPFGAGWFAYFHVADVDAKARENEAAGGRTHMPASDMPGVGRMAMVEDAKGIVFYLMTPDPATADQPSTSFHDALPQRCSWNELVTTDHKAMLPVYGTLFGWVSNEAMPMGDMGDYSFIDCGGTRLGAMMDRADPAQPLRWTFYFRVPYVDAAVARITAGGGRVIDGPMDVPGGQRALVAVDPQGAAFGLASGERQ